MIILSSLNIHIFSQDCATLLQEELDQLDNKHHDTQSCTLDRVDSVEQLMSPTDENVGIFSRIEDAIDGNEIDNKNEETEAFIKVSKVWLIVLLLSHFHIFSF